jgi:hypothetical protein
MYRVVKNDSGSVFYGGERNVIAASVYDRMILFCGSTMRVLSSQYGARTEQSRLSFS